MLTWLKKMTGKADAPRHGRDLSPVLALMLSHTPAQRSCRLILLRPALIRDTQRALNAIIRRK